MANLESNGDELLECSFKFHNFVIQVGEVSFGCQVIKMQDSLYLWIGNNNDKTMNDLSFAFMSNYESIPVATKIIGSTDDSTSSNMAKRLTKKCGKAIYISFNVTADKFTLPGIEKSVFDELKQHPELMS